MHPFTDVIVEAELPKQHPGQANRIFRGKRNEVPIALRVPRDRDPDAAPFYDGVGRLFGLSILSPAHYRQTHQWLTKFSPISAPRLIDIGQSDAGMAILHEWIDGTPAADFGQLSEVGAARFGSYLANLHRAPVMGYGSWRDARPANDFWDAAVKTMRYLAETYTYKYDDATRQVLATMDRSRTAIQRPEMGLIMLDIHPSQFFVDRGAFTRVIDTEFIVLGPPEMELVALERMIDTRTAQAIRAGYEAVRPFPNLAPVRDFYRALNRALWIHGDEPADVWRNAPVTFGEA
ncbi:aminoglycoside phosphotransferase family protein [Alicyclobacillus acidiphilus]|uniref:aminoglycoside phosphotransferase family protein n=1 Tax=Alicyclobacillus acidiphilus TaxID=182455 RepID=UPI001FE07AA4|nr:aminoglycoside phosphotransferase family protein [Alicyclobacillus acidiphilus]